jgi:hypothetical protein
MQIELFLQRSLLQNALQSAQHKFAAHLKGASVQANDSAIAIEAWAGQSHNGASQSYAELSWLGEEVQPEVKDKVVLRADPVHFLMRRNSLTLTELNEGAQLTNDEAQQLVTHINAFAAQDGISFIAPSPNLSPNRWYALFPSGSTFAPTMSVRDAAGLPVFECLPSQAQEGQYNLQRLGNELQMLLHDHPVNDARAQRGAPPMNAVWFWGGDKEKVQQKNTFQAYCCLDRFHEPFIRGFAQQQGAQYVDAASISSVQYESLAIIASVDDGDALLKLAQLRAQLDAGRLTRLTVHHVPLYKKTFDENDEISSADQKQVAYPAYSSFVLTPKSKYKFWARPPTLL